MNLFRQIEGLKKYTFLLSELVSRDIKVKYKRSFLGVLWALLNPLLMMIVMSVVFSHIFRYSIEKFPVYLLSGQIMFSFLSESTSGAMTSIIYGSGLIKKVYVPKYILPVSKICSSFVTLLYSLMALLVIMIFYQVTPTWNMLLFPIPLIYLFIMCTGIGLILSVLATYFRDAVYLYTVVLQAWMYLTPIFYPVEALPQNIATVIKLNPMYHLVTYFRNVLIYGITPTLQTNIICFVCSFGILLIGLGVFKKHQKNFLLHI